MNWVLSLGLGFNFLGILVWVWVWVWVWKVSESVRNLEKNSLKYKITFFNFWF
jgi:hypothetical protein